VRLALPANTDATLTVETFSGEIESDFPIRLEPGFEHQMSHPRRFEFTLGKGGGRIAAETFSGDVRIVNRGRGTENR
jgi:DUF4097 and DUF4098 domain-containing protein YvlB